MRTLVETGEDFLLQDPLDRRHVRVGRPVGQGDDWSIATGRGVGSQGEELSDGFRRHHRQLLHHAEHQFAI